MKAEDFGKMIKKFFRSLRKNFIDIKFLSISILVLLFASLLVFKPKRGFLEGAETMGDKFKTGEAPQAPQAPPLTSDMETQEESDVLTNELKEVQENDVKDEDVPIPDLTEPCSLCGVECPNKENACMTSKPSCIKCQTEVQEKMEKKSTPIIVNVYNNGSGVNGNVPTGIETTSISPGMKRSDTNMIDGLGYGSNASSNADDGLLGTISEADLKESKEFNDMMKEKEAVKASEASVFPMTNGSEASTNTSDVTLEQFTLIPSFMRSKQSYPLPSSTQMDIDSMNNI